MSASEYTRSAAYITQRLKRAIQAAANRERGVYERGNDAFRLLLVFLVRFDRIWKIRVFGQRMGNLG